MALTKTTLPSTAPTVAVPYDVAMSFGLAVTMTATAYANSAAQVNLMPGRFYGLWALQVSAAAMGSSNEAYAFWLVGSNDSAFGAGNNEVLQMHDIAATAALRSLANIAAASPTVPDAGLTVSQFVLPFVNQIDQYVFQYLQLYVTVAGTAPSVTFNSWVSPFTAGACI